MHIYVYIYVQQVISEKFYDILNLFLPLTLILMICFLSLRKLSIFNSILINSVWRSELFLKKVPPRACKPFSRGGTPPFLGNRGTLSKWATQESVHFVPKFGVLVKRVPCPVWRETCNTFPRKIGINSRRFSSSSSRQVRY